RDGRRYHLRASASGIDAGTRNRRTLYRVEADETMPMIGEPLQLYLPRAAAGETLLPPGSVSSADGRDWVWLHGDAEGFERRAVSVQRRDDGWLRLRTPLDPSARVVVEGAAALDARRPSAEAL
ncbi:MAG: hypothetical protein ACREVL_02540, partial [Solimonas sp.]